MAIDAASGHGWLTVILATALAFFLVYPLLKSVGGMFGLAL